MVAYYATRDLIPLYAVYSLLFRDAGLSPAAISTLLVLWSLTAFLLEIPSGAWADTVDRRFLLVLGAVVYAIGFSTWMLWPTYAGFALGFVLWGISGSLMSGTFEAWLYDELSATGAADRFASLLGWSQSAALVANLVATAAAAPLFAWGGYPAVGWTSVAFALVHGGLALCLPRAHAVESADETLGGDGGRTVLGRYAAMLRGGLSEVARRPRLRRAVLVTAAILGLSAYDEYFPLLLREFGFDNVAAAILLAVIVAAQALGTGLAGPTSRMSPQTMALVLGIAVLALSAGAVAGGVVGVACIAIGYGLTHNVVIVSEARLQEVIEGQARATVTSVSGVSTEVVAISVYAFAALGASWWSIATVVALFGIPALAVARLVPSWMPPHEDRRRGS